MLAQAQSAAQYIPVTYRRRREFVSAREDSSLSAAIPMEGQPATTLRIVEGGLDDPRVIDLLNTHLARARAETAPGSAHALDLSGLRSPEVTFWSAWEGDSLAGVGALKRLTDDHGEVKSMHTAESMRRQGVGAAILRHIIAAARARGMSRVSLETGSWPYFAPARALYERHGFVECPPFADYRPDPNSVFMTLVLTT
jgi:putative acetyltransferase